MRILLPTKLIDNKVRADIVNAVAQGIRQVLQGDAVAISGIADTITL